MKLLRPNLRAPRSDDTLGRGMDNALTLALFVVVGLALDHWLGTSPIFVIALLLLAAVGVFARSKYQYDARMDELEAERLARTSAGAGAGKAGGGGD